MLGLMAKQGAGRLPAGFYRNTILIGLGFFTMGLMDPLYDTYVPIFLDEYLDLRFMTGLVMTLDNVLAIFLIPIVSALSDKTRTPIGRRMPFILVTVPLSGIFFASLPFGARPSGTLAALIVLVFLLNMAKQAARGPVVALMPDTVPGEFRSEANGVINTMGAVAAIVGTVALAPLMDVDVQLPLIGSSARKLPFLLAGLLVILATIALFLFVKERHAATRDETREPIRKSLALVMKNSDKSAFFILISIFFWFLAYQGLLPFVGIYSKDVLGVSDGLAGLSAGAVAIAYGIFAIPSGILAHRIGRKKLIRICLVGVAAVLVLVFFHEPLTRAAGLGSFGAWVIFLVLLFVFGAMWGSVITNSFPMLWQMATFGNVGIYTGLYYFFSQGAAITSPPLAGAIIDGFSDLFDPVVGLRMIFVFAVVCFLVAFLVMSRVKSGEAGEKPVGAEGAADAPGGARS